MKNKLNAIGDPGVRPHKSGGDAVVVQMAKRSQQLDGIATEIKAMFERSFDDGMQLYQFTPAEAHKINGYMNQLEIIADELKRAGK